MYEFYELSACVNVQGLSELEQALTINKQSHKLDTEATMSLFYLSIYLKQ